MKPVLNKPFAADSAVDEIDVLRIKRALNRLGYYRPYEKTGITDIPEKSLFEALEAFQDSESLPVTGEIRPGDDTEKRLFDLAGQKDGKYIWRTVGDNKVRGGHRALEGTTRIWGQGIEPGEEINCRCWAVNLPKDNCEEAKAALADAEEKVRQLSKRFNDLLLRLRRQIDEAKMLIANTKKILGTEVFSYAMTIPFEKLGILGDLIRRHFGNIISDKTLQAAHKSMKEFWAARQKTIYIRDQRDIVLAELERAAKELEAARRRFHECEADRL